MDRLHYGQNFERSGKIHDHSIEEHPKIRKIAKFGREMLQNEENIALQSLRILYTFVLRTEN